MGARKGTPEGKRSVTTAIDRTVRPPPPTGGFPSTADNPMLAIMLAGEGPYK
jgi:hypothetical protein